MEDKQQKKGKEITLNVNQNADTRNESNYSQNQERKNEEPIKYFSADEDDLAIISQRIQQMVFRRSQNHNYFKTKEILKIDKQNYMLWM